MIKVANVLEEKFLLDNQKHGQEISLVEGVLIDTDALIALAKSDDFNHKKAVQLSKKLQKKGVFYYLSPFTVSEAVTVLSHKVSHQAAKSFLKEMRKLNLPVFESRENLTSLADKWFLKQKKKRVSYPDCYNMALMERYKSEIRIIFSFDSTYKKNGFKTVEDLEL